MHGIPCDLNSAVNYPGLGIVREGEGNYKSRVEFARMGGREGIQVGRTDLIDARIKINHKFKLAGICREA